MLDTTSCQFPTMESPQCGFVNLLQTGKNPALPTSQERVPCTKEEEEKLADAWVSAFQYPVEGDNKTFNCFWEKVRSVFCALTGSESRNLDQISSKWRDIRLKCIEFGGVYNNLQNIRKSWSNDFDVFNTGLDQFEKTTSTRKTFSYQTEEASQTSLVSKCSRNLDATSQQSDGRTHIDINNDPLDLEDGRTLRRPVGRNKAKKQVYWLRVLVLSIILERNLIDMSTFKKPRRRY
uniref:Myb/SANT-like domain-containing protein n=1 Tax=Lactuca sativa TaxID=4236 RepID=A0A9R1XUX4_LACSA|nr:hypothetical protein LSAT_V11C200073710 [Lactuca sativa]